MIRCLVLLTFYVGFLWFTIRSFWSCFLFDCIRGKTDQRPKIRKIITIHFAFHRRRHIYNLRVLAKQTPGLSIVRNGRGRRIVSLTDREERNMVDHFLVECGIWIKMTEHIAGCSHWFIRLWATSKKYINIYWGRFKQYFTGVIRTARYGDGVEFSRHDFINARSTWPKFVLNKGKRSICSVGRSSLKFFHPTYTTRRENPIDGETDEYGSSYTPPWEPTRGIQM